MEEKRATVQSREHDQTLLLGWLMSAIKMAWVPMLLLTGIGFFPDMAFARSECEAWQPALSSDNALLFGVITIKVGDLFNPLRPAESRLIHSTANALHIATRQSTIASVLPFRSGDAFSADLLEEGERLLREKRYLREATVTPVRRCGNSVDVLVRTVDNWTLTPSVSVSSAGGVSGYSFEMQDLNVLGLGKELTFRVRKRGVENESTLIYADDNVLGGRHRIRLELGDTDDGRVYGIAGGLPFYSSVSPNSWWFSYFDQTESFVPDLSGSSSADSEIDPASSEQSDATALVASTSAEAHVAKRVAGNAQTFGRIGVGARVERQETAFADNVAEQEPGYDFDERYPFVFAAWSRSEWSERTNFHAIGKTEDVNLGLSAELEAGLLLQLLGNDNDGVRFAGTVSQGWQFDDASLHFASLARTQYFDGQPATRSSTTARYEYFRWLNRDDQLDLRLVGERNDRYSPIYDFHLGGQYGLKGYPDDYQRGSRRVLALAEYRHVTDWKPFELVHAAFTVFGEAGRTWSAEEAGNSLADIGVGLALSPTRSSRNATARFDISVPLIDRGAEDVDSFQLFIGSQIEY